VWPTREIGGTEPQPIREGGAIEARMEDRGMRSSSSEEGLSSSGTGACSGALGSGSATCATASGMTCGGASDSFSSSSNPTIARGARRPELPVSFDSDVDLTSTFTTGDGTSSCSLSSGSESGATARREDLDFDSVVLRFGAGLDEVARGLRAVRFGGGSDVLSPSLLSCSSGIDSATDFVLRVALRDDVAALEDEVRARLLVDGVGSSSSSLPERSSWFGGRFASPAFADELGPAADAEDVSLERVLLRVAIVFNTAS
jgi:hypothetical protein